MPPKSEKQRRLMQAVLHDPKVSKKHGISKADARKVLGKHPKSRKKKKGG